MMRLDDVRHAAVVAKRRPKVAHQDRQIGLDDERIRPEPLHQFRFRQNPWTLVDEQLEKLEDFGGEVNGLALSGELPADGVKSASAERVAHGNGQKTQEKMPQLTETPLLEKP